MGKRGQRLGRGSREGKGRGAKGEERVKMWGGLGRVTVRSRLKGEKKGRGRKGEREQRAGKKGQRARKADRR